jgi:hypothetical protein
MEYKGYNIVSDGTYGMRVIKGIGRGALPKDLNGAFSSDKTARKAIDLIVAKKEIKYGEVLISN